MIEELILKQLSILFISAVKFMVAAPTSYLLGYSYFHTLLNMIVGGLAGVLFFNYSGRYLFSHFPVWRENIRRFQYKILGVQDRKTRQRVPAKVFNRRNRTIVKIRERFGFPGLIILTPVLLSIPIGTFLVVKYYSSRRGLIGWLSLSVIAWSFLLSTFIRIF